MMKGNSFAIGNRRLIRMVLALVLVTFWQFALTSKPALAHVILIRSTPADGARLQTAPGELELWFNEPIVVRRSLVRLLDQTNQPVAGVAIQSEESAAERLRVIAPLLPAGGYTLFWQTLAETDGHISQGFVLFSIGTAGFVPPRLAPATEAFPSLTEGVLRWFNLLLLAAAVGALAIVQFVLTPVSAQGDEQGQRAQEALQRRLLRWAAASAGGAFLVGIGLLVWQVAITQTSAPLEANWVEQARFVITQTRWGLLWLVRQVVLLWLCGGLWLIARRHQPISSWVQLAVYGRAIDLLIIQGLSGHAMEGSLHWLPALGNATLHLLAASFWIGGLLALALVARPALRRNEENTGWRPIRWRSFSQLAALSVAVLAISGLVSMGQQVASLDGLVTTHYGQLLLGKVGLVLLTALWGFGNALVVHPTLAAPLARWQGRPPGWTPLPLSRLPQLLTAEVACGVLVFALTGLLTTSAPPRGVEFTMAPEAVQPMLVQRVDDLLVTLEVRPNRPGQNLFRIRTVDTKNPTVITRFSVRLRLNPAEPAQATAEGRLVAAAEDNSLQTYQVTSDALNLAGTWPIEVTVQRQGEAERVAAFRWMMPPGELQPTVLSKYPLAKPLMTAALVLLLLCSVVAGGLGWLSVQRRQPAQERRAVGQPPVIESA